MNDLLSHELAQLNLKPGQCQLVQVNGYQVEVRRLEEEKSDFEDMVMLEPWVTLSDGAPTRSVEVRYAPHPLPVPPDIPQDEEEPV